MKLIERKWCEMKIAAIDIGGTSIKAGLFVNGQLTRQQEIDTNAFLGGKSIFQKVCQLIDSYEELNYIGISTAGQVNAEEGYLIFANENIPEYTGMQLKKRLESIYQIEVFVENDVNAAALGEAYFGAGIEAKDFLCLTYGTGIGGAIVMNKEIYHGDSFSAGEFGALIVHGKEHQNTWGYFDGCYEKYASTTALMKKAKQLDPKYTNGRILFEDMEVPEVKELIYDWIEEIVLGLVSLIHIFNPSHIILGGGIMARAMILDRINLLIYERIMPNYRSVIIKNTILGNQAGLYGAIVPILNK